MIGARLFIHATTMIRNRKADAYATVHEWTRIIDQLRAENVQLRLLLQAHGIAPPPVVSHISEKPTEASSDRAVTKRSTMHEKTALFLSRFQGRPDVYARRWESKTSHSGYSPVCVNEWKPGVCLKPKGKCADCANAADSPYDERAVEDHLCGRHVLGVYPLLRDDTCRFLSLISMKKTGAATCRWSLIPVAKTVFHHQATVTAITRIPESLPVSSRRTAEMVASMLCERQVNAIFREGIHQKYAIMDGSVVWYGSINLLSFGASQESIMRLVSSSIARALQETKA